MTESGAGVERDLGLATEYYRKAAEKGHRSAQLKWGLALIEGRHVQQDLVTGELWLRRAALAGNSRAAALVGNLYAQPGPLPPNYVEAATWYRRAAEAGEKTAARALGSLYLTGAGVARDDGEAARCPHDAHDARRRPGRSRRRGAAGGAFRRCWSDAGCQSAGLLGPRSPGGDGPPRPRGRRPAL